MNCNLLTATLLHLNEVMVKVHVQGQIIVSWYEVYFIRYNCYDNWHCAFYN